MAWHGTVGGMLARAAGPVAGVFRNPSVLLLVFGFAIVVALSAVLWWTADRLSEARDRLATVRADMAQCVQANARASATVEALRETVEWNKAERERALADQAAAVRRLEQWQREQEKRNNDAEIQKVVSAAGGDRCASSLLPDRVRLLVSPSAGDN